MHLDLQHHLVSTFVGGVLIDHVYIVRHSPLLSNTFHLVMHRLDHSVAPLQVNIPDVNLNLCLPWH